MAAYHDPKSLRDSLELDYFRRPRPLARWLWRGNAFALVAALGCVGWSLWPTHHAAFQAGPVSIGHALVGHDCEVCHDRPFATAGRFLAPAGHTVSDAACTQCHGAPDHHSSAPARDCASCHREHRGTGLLARVADDFCLTCHRDSTPIDGKPFTHEPVQSFAAHPEFALWRQGAEPRDPGTIAFHHAKHLDLTEDALRTAGEDRRTNLAAEYAKLKSQRCGYCHQTDAAGRYMEPIRYEKRCATCHPLWAAVTGEERNPALKDTLAAFALRPAPHPKPGETSAIVRALLRDRYLTFAQDHPSVLKNPPAPPAAPLPGSPLRGRPARHQELTWSSGQLQEAERLLFDVSGGCLFCHTETARRDGLPTYAAPAIPNRWFPHSRFRHDAHRLVRCESCHHQTPHSATSDQVLMPTIATCQQCHSSAGGARTDCVECHLYHHGERRGGNRASDLLTLRPAGAGRE